MHKPKTLYRYCRNNAFSSSSYRKHENITSERKNEHIKPSSHYQILSTMTPCMSLYHGDGESNNDCFV